MNKINLENIDTSMLESFDTSFLITIAIGCSIPIIATINYVLTPNDLNGYIYECTYSLIYNIAYIVIYAGIIFMDADRIKNAGLNPPSKWWVLFTPVYLWKRANILNQSKLTFVLCWAINIFSVLIAMILELAFFE